MTLMTRRTAGKLIVGGALAAALGAYWYWPSWGDHRAPGSGYKALQEQKAQRPQSTSFKGGVGFNIASWTAGELPVCIGYKRQQSTPALISADITSQYSYRGQGSVMCRVEAEPRGGLRAAEGFLDLRDPPFYEGKKPYVLNRDANGKPMGVDLAGRTLSVRVLIPRELTGTYHAPNGIQLFAKSLKVIDGKEYWSNYYGSWHNQYGYSHHFQDGKPVDKCAWPEITCELPDRPGADSPEWGHADKDFDPHNVALIGFKYALNDNAEEGVKGAFYLDDLGWFNLSQPEVIFPFDNADNPLLAMKKAGGELAAIVQTEYMKHVCGTKIRPDKAKSHTTTELAQTMDYCHENGLRVLLKPHIDIFDENAVNEKWRGLISPDDVDGWFREYEDMILHYAALAEKHQAEMLVVGSELRNMAKAEHRERWSKLISDVRQVYAGPLTYAANWDDYKDVSFWDKVDYIGIHAYMPLSEQRDPTEQELRDGWKGVVIKGLWHTWLKNLREFSAAQGKPIIFTEIGCRPIDYGCDRPWDNTVSQPINLELQKRYYAAAIETFKDEPWCKGLLFWYLTPRKDGGGPLHDGFTPQGKPAMQALRH
jgi:hypothetical protein